MGKVRVYLWDNLKVILMLLVIMTHSVCLYQGERWTEFYWILVMTFTMPLFTIISGFWYRPKSIKDTAIRFLYPCILFSIVNFLWGGLFYEPYMTHQVSYLSLGYAMWYLWALFVYYCITPVLLRFFSIGQLLILSFLVSWIAGFFTGLNTQLQISRVICFYPFFLIGKFLHEYYLHKIYSISTRQRIYAAVIFILAVVAYIVADCIVPGIVYITGFTGGFGLSAGGFILRVFTQCICIVMSLALIALIPNRQLFFTKYGLRTMNAYLLHMLIVFPLSWGIGTILFDRWYGYLWNILVVPFICLLLFNEKIDTVMRKILFIKK